MFAINQRLYLIGIDGYKTQNRVYKLLLENEKVDSDTKLSEFSYKRAEMNETSLINYIIRHKGVAQNVIVDNIKKTLKGTQGSLDRYDTSKGTVFVILGEVRARETGKLMGYRLTSSSASEANSVKKLSLRDTMEIVKSAQARGVVPFANGQFVQATLEKSAYIRSYLSKGFNIEFIATNRENRYAKKTVVDPKNKERAKSKWEGIFTAEQIAELKAANNAGVDIRIIASPKLSPKQMNVIWTTKLDGYKAELFADPAYSEDVMEYLSAELETGSNISVLLNPAYNVEQMVEITLGLISGVDISKYADPKNDAKKMEARRSELERKLWKSYRVAEGKLA